MADYVIYFSPTGGTKKVAGILGDCLEEVRTVDITVNAQELELAEEDRCIVAVPSYGGRVPALATERLRQIRGNGAKAVAVAVFGNRAIDDTLLELKNNLTKQGFRVAAAMEAVAEHSIMRQFGAGRPDVQDGAQLRTFMEQIDWAAEDVQVPGKEPYVSAHSLPMAPSAGKKCTECGLCARECPVGAITGRETDKTKCITCMRCISVCPAGARSVSPLLLKAGGWMMKKALGGRKENKLYL